MVETFPSQFVCEGDVGYDSKPRRGSLTFQQRHNGRWTCIMRYASRYRPVANLKLDKCLLGKLPPNLTQMCDRGYFNITFKNGGYLTFHSNDGQHVADLRKVAQLLFTIAGAREDSELNFGTAVHDMSVNTLAKSRSNCSGFGGGTVSGNLNYNGYQTPVNKWKNGDRNHQSGHSKSFGGFDGQFNGFSGYRSSQRPSQNCYSDRYLGNRNYGRSCYSDNQTPNSTVGFHRGRARYRTQYKTSPLKGRLKESVENSPHVGLESLRSSSSKSRLLKDRGSAENSLERSEREYGVMDISHNSFSADGKHEAYLNGSSKSVYTAKQDDRITYMNNEAFGCSGTGRNREGVITKVADATSTKSPNPNLGHMRFYGRSNNTHFSDSNPQIASGSISVPVKRQSLSSMVSPAKKNRSNSEEKENRHSLNGACNGGRLLDCHGFVNLGNSCYMNAVLQAIFCLKSFSSDLLGTYHFLLSSLNSNSICRRICELLMERMAPDSLQSTKRYDTLLKSIKEAVDSISSSFLGNKMQDAHEFLTTALEKMSEEIKQANIMAKSAQCTHPIRHHFEYKILERSTCIGCSKVVTNAQVLYDVGLPVPKSKNSAMKSLQQLMNSMFKMERREFICDQCSNKERMVKTSICTIPRILSIHLKRYNVVNRQSIKNINPVSVQRYLTLKNHVDENASFLQSEACTNLSNGSSSDVISGTQCSEVTICNGWHAEEEAREKYPPSLEKTNRNVDQTISGSEKISLPLSNPYSAYWTSKRQGLVGGEAPLKVVLDADEEVTKQKENSEEVPVATVSASALATPKNPERIDNAQDFCQIDEAKEWLNDDDEDMRKAKENSLRTLEEECNRTLEESEADDVDDESLPDMTEEQNTNGDLPHTYQLASVICHMGGVDGGHYTCYQVDWEKKNFQHYDDENVTEISEQEFFQKIQNHGYILFYIHRSLCNEKESLGPEMR